MLRCVRGSVGALPALMSDLGCSPAPRWLKVRESAAEMIAPTCQMHEMHEMRACVL